MWRDVVFAVALALFLPACISHERKESLLTSIERDIADCRASSGIPIQIGHFMYDCIWRADDAGNPCTDTDQCQGRCELPVSMSEKNESGIKILKLKADGPGPIIGACSSYRNRGKPLNCAIHLRDGKAVIETCVG